MKDELKKYFLVLLSMMVILCFTTQGYSGVNAKAVSVKKTLTSTTQDATPLEQLKQRIDPRCYNTGLIKDFYIIEKNGGRVDWLQNGNFDLIAFDKMGKDGYYDVWVMKPDGSDKKCLTSDKPELVPQMHNGNPAWHPSGKYIIFEAEEPGHPPYIDFADSFASQPGWGYYCNLWVMTPDGKKFWKLTNVPYTYIDPTGAVLHPHFSPDGKKLIWAARLGEGLGWGDWAIKVADFDDTDGVPKLINEKEYSQLGPQRYSFYETHSFAPQRFKSLGDTKLMNNKIMIEEGNNQEESIIIFSGNLDIGYDKTQTPGRHQECYLDLYKWDLNRPEEQPRPLTLSFDEWDEHGHFSPSGENIAYISSKGLMEGVEFPLSWWTVLKTDYWLMKENSTKTKLTYFNKPEQEIVDKTTEKRYTCADSSWNSDGSKLAVVVGHATGEKMEGSFIAIMEFKEKK